MCVCVCVCVCVHACTCVVYWVVVSCYLVGGVLEPPDPHVCPQTHSLWQLYVQDETRFGLYGLGRYFLSAKLRVIGCSVMLL